MELPGLTVISRYRWAYSGADQPCSGVAACSPIQLISLFQTFQTKEPDRSPRLRHPSVQCPAFERSRPLPHESHAAVAAKPDVQNQHRPSRERRLRVASLRKARLHRSPSTRRRLLCNACHPPASHLWSPRGIRWGCPEGQTLTDQFFRNLGNTFSEISGKESEFWSCYRNGLLHQVTFAKAKLDTKTGIWVALPSSGISGHDPRPVYFNPNVGRFFLNPIGFFDFVTGTMLGDFSVYEEVNASTQYPLPAVGNPSTVQPGTTPTIGGLHVASGFYNMSSDPKGGS
jgi:hypothetical protein